METTEASLMSLLILCPKASKNLPKMKQNVVKKVDKFNPRENQVWVQDYQSFRHLASK